MKKQTPLALLMATIAILMLAMACGSSDNAVTPPPETVPTQPANQERVQSQPTPMEPTATQAPTNPPTPPPASPSQNQTPWPTPQPTRAPDRTAQYQQAQTATTAQLTPTPEPTPTSVQQIQEPEPQLVADYDGSSPLIHVFVKEPFILFPGTPGASTILPLRGLTEAGEEVSIKDPARWGITFTERFEGELGHLYTIDENGKYTVMDRGPDTAIAGSVRINLPHTYANAVFLHPQPDKVLPEPVITNNPSYGGLHRCSMDLGHYGMDLTWFLLDVTRGENLYNIDEETLAHHATQAGAKPWGIHHQPSYPDWKKGYSPTEGKQSFLIVEFKPDSCPTVNQTLDFTHKMAKIPGVRQVFWVHDTDETFINFKTQNR